MTVITLTTDFGSGDHEVGVLKGVIWKIAPEVKIADLSHDITPHDILQAAMLLWRVFRYFPEGTIHVAVIDPGVGTSRRVLGARFGTQYFVGPDNGLITLLLAEAEKQAETIEFIDLDQTQYWLPEVSHVFHGRDIFAPVAAHLASGIPFSSLGTPISDPIRINIPEPKSTPSGWIGQVLHIDHFGNLSTNLNLSHLNAKKEVIIHINGEQIIGLVSTFGERTPGSLVALFDSTGALAICVVNGNAAKRLNAVKGDTVEVLYK